MATEKQIAANRLNAKKFTGPRTRAGKAASAWNALKTGIDSDAMVLPFEDPDELERLAAEHYLNCKRHTPMVRACLDRVIRAEWMQRRLSRIEPMLLAYKLDEMTDAAPGHEFAAAYLALETTLQRLQTRINAAERNFRNALKDLEFLIQESWQEPSNALASFLNTERELLLEESESDPEPACDPESAPFEPPNAA